MGKSALRAAPLVALIFLLHGCSSLQGRVIDDTYTPVDGAFSVQVPTSRDYSCHDGNDSSLEFVDCAVGGEYWMDGGGYSLEWFKLSGPSKDDAMFYVGAEKLIPQLMPHQGVDKFSIVRTSRLTVNGHAAYQVVALGAVDNIQAYWVATTVNFKHGIATARFLVPSNAAPYQGPSSPEQAVAVPGYQKFLASIQDNGD